MILGTAGHVDHGKSTVVRLLTGTDPDRWDEERRRGLSIGLGFAFLELGASAGGDRTQRHGVVGVVDVPGHGRFLPTMMAGAHAVDVALLVVAAHEGWMPQTGEHVAVLEALGTPCGVVVLSHVDLVDPARLEELERDLRRRLEGSFLQGAPVLHLDGRTGEGLPRLRRELGGQLEAAERLGHRGHLVEGGRPRLWIDRSFVLRGVGRVLTGTLSGGELRVGELVQVVGGGRRDVVGVRSLHVDSAPAEVAPRGRRVGVRVDPQVDPGVGEALVHEGQWARGRHLHAALRPFGDARAPQRGGYELVLGTGRWEVELRRSPNVQGPLQCGSDAEPPGTPGAGFLPSAAGWDAVRLHARDEVAPVAPGDRFVLVDTGTSRVVAQGILLSVDTSVRRLAREALERRLAAVLAGSAGLLAGALVSERGPVLDRRAVVRELGSVPAELFDDRRRGLAVDRAALDRAVRKLADELARSEQGVEVDPDELVACAARQLVAGGLAVRGEGRLWRDDDHRRRAASRLASRARCLAGGRLWRREDLLAEFLSEGLTEHDLVSAVRIGSLTELLAASPPSRSGTVVATEVLEELERRVRRRVGPGAASLADLRDALDLSRREALAVLEHLDARGVTARTGEVRVLLDR